MNRSCEQGMTQGRFAARCPISGRNLRPGCFSEIDVKIPRDRNIELVIEELAFNQETTAVLGNPQKHCGTERSRKVCTSCPPHSILRAFAHAFPNRPAIQSSFHFALSIHSRRCDNRASGADNCRAPTRRVTTTTQYYYGLNRANLSENPKKSFCDASRSAIAVHLIRLSRRSRSVSTSIALRFRSKVCLAPTII